MKINIRDMTMISVFTALTAVGAFISIPIGTVPITLQTFFVILSGLILGPNLGMLSQVLYLFLGLIGIPIFANFTGGFQSILKPSFGFIIGFILASYIVGRITYYDAKINKKRIWMASIIGSIVIYIVGLPYMYYILNNVMSQDLTMLSLIKLYCLAFIPGDIVKIIMSSLLAIKILPLININNVY